MVNRKGPIFRVKMAAKVTKGQIWDGTIFKNLKYPVMYLYTKFHAFIIKRTISP